MSVHQLSGLKASTETFSKVKVGIWSQMLSNNAITTTIRTIVEDGVILDVGCGNSILFWHDKWCESGPLKSAFP